MAQDASVLASILARRLKQAGLTISTAESCTGGMLASALTDIQGASRWYSQGWVTYSNEAKQKQLGVPRNLFIDGEGAAGAVSSEVAEAMAVGSAEKSGSEMAIAVTGIAGPTGATEKKEIGLVWVGIHLNGETFSKSAEFGQGDRHSNKEAFTTFALREALKVWEMVFEPDEPVQDEPEPTTDMGVGVEERSGDDLGGSAGRENHLQTPASEGEDEEWQGEVTWSEGDEQGDEQEDESETAEPVFPDSDIVWGEE